MDTTHKTTAIESLEFSYVLCAIESRIWTGMKTDSDSTVEFTKSKEAESDSGKFMKQLVNSAALARVRNAVNKARAALYAGSVPWLASAHLVKLDRMESLNTTIAEHVAEFETARDKFLEEYPKLVEGAAVRLGRLFDRSDYPSVQALKVKFALDVVWLPVNAVNSSQMCILDNAIAKEVERSTQEATKRALASAQEAMLARALETVGESAKSLKRYSQKKADGDRAVLHESRIEDLSQTAKDLLDYTFHDSENEARKIEQLAVDLKEVAAEGADTLKENEAARKASIDKLAEIQARLASMQPF